MTLPVKKEKTATPFNRRKIVLFGDPKSGKTQLAAAIGDLVGDIMFFAFERGHDDIEGFVQPIDEWPQFVSTIEELSKSDKFKMICIDTLDSAFISYSQWFLQSKGIEYEGDLPYRGWDESRKGFRNAMFSLQHLNRGYIIIAHPREDSIGSGDDAAVVTRPNFPYDKKNMIKSAIEGIADAIWYMGVKTVVGEGNKPIPTKTLFCAHGSKPGFDTGTRFPMPDTLVLVNDDPAASARRVVNAYNKHNGIGGEKK
jgi:hypothetical protein